MKASQLKAIAKQRIAGNAGTLIGAALIYFAILFAVYFVIFFVYSANLVSKGIFNSVESVEAYVESMSNNASPLFLFATDLIPLVVGALMETLAVGLLFMCLNTARLKDVKISDLFFAYKRNPDRVILIALIQSGAGYLCTLIPTLMGRFGDLDNFAFVSLYFIFTVICNILQVIVSILLSQSLFLYIDNPDESVITCVQVSIKIMRNNIWRYFCLSISFIGWLFVVIISCGMAVLFVMPFMYVTFALFYMQLKGELGSQVDVTIQ